MCFCWCASEERESGMNDNGRCRRRATLVPNSESLGRGAPEIASEAYNGFPGPALNADRS